MTVKSREKIYENEHDAVNDFIERKQAMGRSRRTLNAYSRTLKSFFHEEFSDLAPEDVEVRHIEDYVGKLAGTIDKDGNLDTEIEALRTVSQEYLDEGVPVLVPTTYENVDGETVHADAEVIVELGTRGFVGASLMNSRVRSTVTPRHWTAYRLTT